jgi:hypothetical protein
MALSIEAILLYVTRASILKKGCTQVPLHYYHKVTLLELSHHEYRLGWRVAVNPENFQENQANVQFEV